jgi:hypothetical protein
VGEGEEKAVDTEVILDDIGTLSICVEQFGSHWTHFYKKIYFRIFRKSVQKNSSFIKA